MVLLRYPKGMGGQRRAPSKLQPPLQGPYKVLSFVGAEYKIQSEADGNNRIITTHIQNLEPFEIDELREEPREVANKDKQLTTIKVIRGHDGIFKTRGRTKLSNLQFHVEWEGIDFNPKDNECLATWNQLKDTQALHDYLIKINQRKLIPIKYRK